jgi:perosamine synthetase
MGVTAEGAYPVAERLARRGFYIPSGMALGMEQIESVASIVREEVEAVKG